MPKVPVNTFKGVPDGLLNNRRRSRVPRVLRNILQLSEQGNHVEILKNLDNEETDVSTLQMRSENTDTALHVAATRGHLKTVCVLIGTVLNVEITGHRMRTALHCSAANGHQLVTRRLLDAGATVDARDAHGDTPLQLAEKNEHANVVLLLAKKGAKMTEETIYLAISKGNKDLVELCLEKGTQVDTDKNEDSLVVLAARQGKWDIVSLLLDKGANGTICKEIKESALVYAAKAGEARMVRKLLEAGCKQDSGQVKCAIMFAKNKEVVHVFYDVVPNYVQGETGGNSFLRVAMKGRLESLKAFCEMGMDINYADGKNQTALYYAAQNGHLHCLKELIDRHASLNVKNLKGNTALHAASSNGHEECVRMLWKANANLKEKNISRKTPYDVAKSEKIRLILSHPQGENVSQF